MHLGRTWAFNNYYLKSKRIIVLVYTQEVISEKNLDIFIRKPMKDNCWRLKSCVENLEVIQAMRQTCIYRMFKHGPSTLSYRKSSSQSRKVGLFHRSKEQCNETSAWRTLRLLLEEHLWQVHTSLRDATLRSAHQKYYVCMYIYICMAVQTRILGLIWNESWKRRWQRIQVQTIPCAQDCDIKWTFSYKKTLIDHGTYFSTPIQRFK